jgi:hypothetical protein
MLLALRPYRPCRVALARGTLASPDRCAAVHRSANNSWVLAVPRSMCDRTLSKYLRTSRSVLSALATSDIKLALRIPCAQRSDEQPVLAPYRLTSVACIVTLAGVARLQLRAARVPRTCESSYMHRDHWIPADDRTIVFRLLGCSLTPQVSHLTPVPGCSLTPIASSLSPASAVWL